MGGAQESCCRWSHQLEAGGNLLEAFCGPDDPPKDQLIKLWKSKDPEWVHHIKIAALAARAVVLKSLRHEEVIQEEQIKLSLQFRCRFVTELASRSKYHAMRRRRP